MSPRGRNQTPLWGFFLNAPLWLPLGLFFGVGLLLVFLGSGNYGLYLDDYVHKALATMIPGGGFRRDYPLIESQVRQFGQMLLFPMSYLVSYQEWAARTVQLVLHGLTFVLFGALVYRLLRSVLAAACALLFLAFAFPAFESWLWMATIHLAAANILAFLVAHLWLSGIESEKRPVFWLLAAVVLFGLIQPFYEQPMVILGALPLLALAKDFGRARFRRVAWRSLPVILAGLLITALNWYFFLRHSIHALRRMSLSAAQAPFLERLGNSFKGGFSFCYHLRPFALEAFDLGMLTGSTSLGFCLLLGSGILALIWAVHRVSATKEEARAASPLWPWLLAGFLWWAFARIPSMLGGFQASRLELVPLFGLAFMLGAVVQRLSWRMPSLRRLAVLGLGTLCLFNIVALAGLVKAHAELFERDGVALSAIVRAIPDPPQAAIFLPLSVDTRYGRTPLPPQIESRLLYIFFVDWSLSPALQVAYERPDLGGLGKIPWNDGKIGRLTEDESGRVTELFMDETRIPIEKLVPFQYRDGRVWGIDPLTVSVPEEGRKWIVHPPALRDAASRGLPLVPGNLELRQQAP